MTRPHAARNFSPLTSRQIDYARLCWTVLCEDQFPMDVSRAGTAGSSTAFDPVSKAVFLGADAEPGAGQDANSRMSMLACLSHELAHAERDAAGLARPSDLPILMLDEAETSIHAATRELILGRKERMDLVEDARDRLELWLEYMEKNS